MKRKVALAAGIAALAIGLGVGTHLGAKVDPPPAPAAQTRVAVMNMQEVANKYTKTGVLKAAIEKDGTEFDKQLKEIQSDMQKYNPLPADPVKAEAAQKELMRLKRLGEDKTIEKNKYMTDKLNQGEQTIYKDIEAAVQVYARSKSIDLVTFYNDVSDASLKYSPEALRKRITTSGTPIYMSAGVDISAEVIHVLNWNFENSVKPKGSNP